MKKIEENTKIVFTKDRPENDHQYSPLIEKIGIEDNYFALHEDYAIFRSILEDFGVNSVVYYHDADSPLMKGCDYEIRISPYILIKNFDLTEFNVNATRLHLFEDAWYGNGEVFSRQIDPGHPIGLNITERLNAFINDPILFEIDYLRSRYEHLPENGFLEDLTDYIDEIDLWIGDKPSDYQIRLLYNDPHRHFQDLISVFNLIKQDLNNYFEFIVETD